MAKEITIGASHTFKVGPYESLKIEASATFTQPMPKDWRIKAQEQLRQLVEDTLKAQDHSEMARVATSLRGPSQCGFASTEEGNILAEHE